MAVERRHIEVHGTVQGVGFRPFVYRLASRHGLAGWVLNRSGGVEIGVEGPRDALEMFLAELPVEAPPLARIDGIAVREEAPVGCAGFEIRASAASAGEPEPVPPDTATCADCLRELLDPADRRYRYPFINCTNCGPRFTVIEGLPYDRPLTTMHHFPMCAACEREYHDPGNRRFHAQPNACPVCGPQVWLRANELDMHGGAIALAAERLRSGEIVAVKALGGFHLACDWLNNAAVDRLRVRKRRGAKPFAVMFPDVAVVRRYCELSAVEERLLTSERRPIVLLHSGRAPAGLNEVGAMLPSTPLHHLLLGDVGGPLVMTSGNLSEEPIAAANEEALARLGGIADAFLLHDREIASRYDDSVTRVFGGVEVLVRRARSYAPEPVALPAHAERSVLACGAHLKSTFCLAKGRRAYMSQHIGDLENLETLNHYRETLEAYQRLFDVRPEVVAHDMHPEYLSTKYALALDGVEHVAVQHHHAHIVSCLAEHALGGPAIGVAYDGLGYGVDGHLWGGEILLAGWRGFERILHLREAPMPGGTAAIRKPYRMAASYILDWLPEADFAPFLETVPELPLLRQQVERRLNAPPTSSCGRLFDAVSALLGICREAQYEGQAAMELQAAADMATEGSYPYDLRDGVIDPAPALLALYREHLAGTPAGAIAMRFHRTVAEWTAEACRQVQRHTGVQLVALGGGVFQNTLLLGEVLARLEGAVYPRRLPANDGGLSFGQAVVALSLTCDHG